MTWWRWASTLPSAKKRCLRFEFHPVGASLQFNGSTLRRGGESSLADQALHADGVLYSTLRALHQDLRIKHGFLIAKLRELSRSSSHHIARVGCNYRAAKGRASKNHAFSLSYLMRVHTTLTNGLVDRTVRSMGWLTQRRHAAVASAAVQVLGVLPLWLFAKRAAALDGCKNCMVSVATLLYRMCSRTRG
jgi:hypothetical protein